MQQQEIASDVRMPQGSIGRGGHGGVPSSPLPPTSPPPTPYILNSTPKHSLSLPKHCGLYTAGRSCLNQQSPRWQGVHSYCESRQPGQYPAGSCNIRYGVLTANTCKCGASCSERTHAWPTNRSQFLEPGGSLHMITDSCCTLSFRSAFLVNNAAGNAAASCRTIQLTLAAM